MSETAPKAREYGSGSGSTRLWAIEARSTYPEPQVLHGMVLTKEWRRVHVRRVSNGELSLVTGAEVAAVPMVPVGYELPANKLTPDLVEEAQATLLAARFQMQPDGRTALCVETRLVQVEVVYQFSAKEVGVTEPYSLFESTRFLVHRTTPRDHEAQIAEAGAVGQPSKPK